MKKILHTDALPDLRQYGVSQGVETEHLVFVAAMAYADDGDSRDPRAETVADETRICLERLRIKLQAVGCDLDDVVKTTCYLSDRNFYSEFAAVYKEFWAKDQYPLRCTVFVGIADDCRVEIDAIAVKSRTGEAGTS